MLDAPIGAVHHVEVWVVDLAACEPGWAWLLGCLGYHRDRSWPGGSSYHLAFHAGSRGDVEAIVAAAGEHGWRLLFPDVHPHAGGPDHYAAFLEDIAGYEVELVAR